MEKLDLMIECMDYIENHLDEDMKTVDIASACNCSKSTLEKIFRCVNSFSVHDYIVRRRMMLAARTMKQRPEESFLNIAVQYGYSSHESFTRAFKEVWNCTPSEFRTRKFAEVFPRLWATQQEGDTLMKSKKNVDITELYDLFKERKDCYFVCCDIKELVPINDISLKAGDMAILESMTRMINASGDEDVVFRIGGDEFCMLTNSPSEEYAERIVAEIKGHNGETFKCDNHEIPLTLHVNSTKLSIAHLKYDQLFTKLHDAIEEGKED